MATKPNVHCSKSMKNCGVHCVNSVITISLTRHEKLENWGRTNAPSPEMENIIHDRYFNFISLL
ncbi:TPA: hypothetical protein ACV18W_004673, partial [Escherichia coli]